MHAAVRKYWKLYIFPQFPTPTPVVLEVFLVGFCEQMQTENAENPSLSPS